VRGVAQHCPKTVRRTRVGLANRAEEGRTVQTVEQSGFWRPKSSRRGRLEGTRGLQMATGDVGIVNLDSGEEGRSSKRVATRKEERSRFSVVLCWART
jgi:hypothetical protein